MNIKRREFISGLASASTALCLGCTGTLFSQDKHRFENTLNRQLSFKQYFEQRYKHKYIPILKHLEEYLGKEKLWEMLKKASWEENVRLGQRLSPRISSLDFFSRAWNNQRGLFPYTMTYEIVEDTRNAFEVKVTECLTEVVFRENDALGMGYASVCHADFALEKGLSIDPPIKMVRDKTLMQGHDCCNHRYTWAG